MPNKIRWGILGTGAIARKFAEGLSVLPGAELIAVGSRSSRGAQTFGEAFHIPRRHASYAALAADPEVDVIYVATPHPLHKENSMLCLNAGKAVLCEKPFTINAAEARAVVALAREKKLFLMEGMWTRFIPAIVKARELVRDGVIGDVRMLHSHFGFRADDDETGRLVAPELGGGSLLDVGIYPLAFAYMVFGHAPEKIVSMAALGKTGVDEQAAFVLGFKGGALAVCSSAVRTTTPHDTYILGTKGMLRIHAPFWCAERISVISEGAEDVTYDCPLGGNGFNCEASAVMDCLRAGKLEHPWMPLDETLEIMSTMDEIRAQWGLKYPME
jgi:predicted dehydrogenase